MYSHTWKILNDALVITRTTEAVKNGRKRPIRTERVKHGLVTVDSRMAEDPARWHLEGLEPKYKDTKEVEMLAALEGLELGGGLSSKLLGR